MRLTAMVGWRLTFPDIVREAGGSAAGWDVVKDYLGHCVVWYFDDGDGSIDADWRWIN
jgi:hypothetical protein